MRPSSHSLKLTFFDPAAEIRPPDISAFLYDFAPNSLLVTGESVCTLNGLFSVFFSPNVPESTKVSFVLQRR